MKIINIIQCTNLGGMERASLRLMTSLMQRGHEFSLVSLNQLGKLEPELREASIHCAGLNYWGPAGLSIIPPLFQRLRREKASDIIMTGPNWAAMMAMKLARRRGSFLSVHFHHQGVKDHRSWRLIYRLALDRFDWVTFPSNYVRDEACQILPELTERSTMIRYPMAAPAVRTTVAKNAARVRLGIADHEFVVGNAGWLIARKRFDVFIRVAARLVTAIPDVKFLIAGGGPEESSLKKLASDLGVADRIVWLGWLTDMSDFQNSLDVMHFNTDWDALGLTPMETSAMGIPLVASVANGGLREVVDEAAAKRILEKHDIEALAEQIVDIARNPQRAQQAAAATREHYLRISDPELIASQHEQLLAKR